MYWYELLIPAAVTALLIRLDGFLIGPYWALSEVVAGMGGLEEQYWYERRRISWALIRRFAYPLLLAALLATIQPDHGAMEGALYGAATAGLLLWPILFAGLPLGVLPRDWLLIPLYTGFFMGFTGAGALGAQLVNTARTLADGGLREYLGEHLFGWLLTLLMTVVGGAFFYGAKERLADRKRKREEIGYEAIAEQGDPFAR